MIRVLHVIGAMDRAGAETFIMNIYRAIDRNKVQFDFLVHSDRECDYDKEIEQLGGRIFRVPRYNVLNKRSYADAVRRVLREHPEIAIMHSHIGSSAPVHLEIAREEGLFAIAHSHRQTRVRSIYDLAFYALSNPVRGRADWYMACSEQAGLDRFGEKLVQGTTYSLIANGIDPEMYRRDNASIISAKQALGVEGRPVFGHVGRFVHEKNHPFLISTFQKILRDLPNAILLLVGRGELEEKTIELVESKGLGESVRFLGLRDDIPDVLRAIDVFLFPSHREGLPVAFVEAQTIGLECIVSTGLPEKAVFSERAKRMPLDSTEEWAKEATAAYERATQHEDDCIEKTRAAGFDIKSTADRLQRFYSEHS